jgi:adenylate cyclase
MGFLSWGEDALVPTAPSVRAPASSSPVREGAAGYVARGMSRSTLSPPRRILRWLDARPALGAAMASVRRALPGDPRFGDSLSTAGSVPAQVAGRWTSRLRGGRLGMIGEVGLAALQVADWAGGDGRVDGARPELTILFTDLAGYSAWALEAGDDLALRLVRRIDARSTHEVERGGGDVVKRLGDGLMAVFDSPDAAVGAGLAMVESVANARVDGYEPRLRVGIHHGRPLALGGDYLGVDVTIAARLCEAAEPGQVLISETARPSLGHAELSRPGRLRGVPEQLAVFSPAHLT